jgi:ATP-dependent helicase/nuclease subunit A
VELPSKVTATELKGRYEKDGDAEELMKPKNWSFRMPTLGGGERSLTAAERGVATHLVLQYMDFSKAGSREGIKNEIQRLKTARYLSAREAEAVNVSAIERLFRSDLGRRMLAAKEPLREFRFSLLLDADRLYPGTEGEQLLLQGVVDCCLEEDGALVIIDYKTDNVRTEEEIAARAELYRGQLAAYAEALGRIFQKPVKEGTLYFLAPGREVRVF